MKNYKVIDLQQGSEEWLEFRKGKITASLIASILGIKDAFLTKQKAKEVIQGVYTQPKNKAMIEGLNKEDEIRKKAKQYNKVDYIEPIVIQSTQNSLYVASLDGIDKEGNIYEFKYSDNEYNKVVNDNEPSQKYNAQVQFQLYLSNADVCRFGVMNKKGKFIQCDVKRDDDYIIYILNCINDFVNKYLVNDYDDIEIISCGEAYDLAKKIKELTLLIKPYTAELEKLKKKFLDFTNNKNVVCGDVRTYSMEREIIDYKQIIKDKNINIEEKYITKKIIWGVKVK